MVKFLFVLGLSVSVSLFLPEPCSAFRSVSVGMAAPAVAVLDLDAREVKVSFGQRVAVLVFWRPNQPFSTEALKDLDQIRKEFSQRGVEILAIVEETGQPAPSRESVKALGISYPIYLDPARQVEEAYGVIVFPSTGIVGGDGRLKFYLPSRNSNYQEIVRGRLKVELGLMTEKDFAQRMKQIGEDLGGERVQADEHLKIGLRLSRQGKSKEALRELKQAAALDPDLMDVPLALGYAHLESGETRVAQREFEWVLERYQASPGAKLGLGIITARAGNLDKGIHMLKEAIQINPDPVKGYYELGLAYENKGDLKEAMQAYKWAVRKLLQGRR